MDKKNRFGARLVLALVAGLLASIGAVGSAKAAYPDRPIHIIVPFPPGGPNDVLARLVGQRLSKMVGQSVIVDNRPGGATIIGTEAALQAPADGYTLLMVSPSHVINPALRAHMPYDLLRDFTPVIELAASPEVLVTNPSFPAKTVNQLLALAKAKPGHIDYASDGVGTATNLAALMLCQMAHVRMTGIPYTGAGPATTALLGGQVSWMFSPIISVSPYVKAGTLRAIAVAGSRPSPILPNVPTVAAAIPGFDATSVFGIVVRAGTPPAVVGKLNVDFQRILKMPALHAQLTKEGAEVVGGTPGQFRQELASSIRRWKNVVQEGHLKLQ